MTIETKYSIGNAVWVIAGNKAQHLRIEAKEVSIGKAMITEDGDFSICEYKVSYSVAMVIGIKKVIFSPPKKNY